jgi:hypothetical protein
LKIIMANMFHQLKLLNAFPKIARLSIRDQKCKKKIIDNAIHKKWPKKIQT